MPGAKNDEFTIIFVLPLHNWFINDLKKIITAIGAVNGEIHIHNMQKIVTLSMMYFLQSIYYNIMEEKNNTHICMENINWEVC
jgi:hypothetical protein